MRLSAKHAMGIMFMMQVCTLATRPAAAQSPSPLSRNQNPLEATRPNERTLRVSVELVLVNVTVTDPYDRLVTGLEAEHFRVFEDKVEQEIVHFTSEDVPISIGVIFDLSGSMRNKIYKARLAAAQFFKTANPEDEFLLVTFNDRAQLASRFTSSIEELQTRLMFTATKGRTALLDAIYLGLSQMKGARHAKRALIIISDGGDNHSRYNEKDLKNFVEESDVQLYAIGIYEPPGHRTHTSEEFYGPSLLTELTEMTGGRMFPVESLNDLADIAAKISVELRNQYLLAYKPGNRDPNGKWRKIKVLIRPPKGLPPLNVYAKAGYYAPNH